MRILLLGDYSNFNRCLSIGLSRMGHDVTVASDGCRWMDTARQIDLSRPLQGKAGGALLWLRLRTLLARDLRGYDVVAVNNPVFVDLQPHRVMSLFRWLKRNNGSVFLTAMGTDSPYVRMCVAEDSPLRYNEFRINGCRSPFASAHPETEEAWLRMPLSDHCRRIYDGIDGAVSALYEYHLAIQRVLPPEKVAYGGIPVDLADVRRTVSDEVPERVTLFLGRHSDRMLEKGTDRMEAAARAIVGEMPGRCRLEIVENQPYARYQELLGNAHVMLDQLYSYTPATNALLGMARGMTVVTGAEPEYYDFIGERINRPIINAVPDDAVLADQLRTIVSQPDMIPRRAESGRRFVTQHNSTEAVAGRFVDFWMRRLNML
ncbi:MAG: glycosyltransferase family 1 protein [Muribaculaceae bacterium]|nr:glycosyltransferase family 1 protein [Muribaculaceae bacterium]